MECLATFLLFFVVACWLFATMASRLLRRSKERNALLSVARQFGGHYAPGRFFSKSSARFRYGETWAMVTHGRSSGPLNGKCLQVKVHWAHSGVACELTTRSDSPNSPRPRPHWPEVPVDSRLAQSFRITGRDAADTRQLLTSGVCWQLERLAKLGSNPQLHVLIRDGVILVEKPWPEIRGELLAPFIQGVLEFHDQCALAKAAGIQFLATEEAQPLDHVLCKICGEEIREQMVVCRRCKTPHHQECWEYSGACSVFGCRETAYFVPPVGIAVRQSDAPGGRKSEPPPDSTSQ